MTNMSAHSVELSKAQERDLGRAYWRERWHKKGALVERGMEDLRLWLADQAQLGVAQLLKGGREGALALASSMLNVECKGVSRHLEHLASLLDEVDEGASDEPSLRLSPRARALQDASPLDQVLLLLGELTLLSEAFEHLSLLSFEQRVSLLTAIGLGEMPKSAREKPELEGRWVALGCRFERDGGLLSRRLWLARLSTISEDEVSSGDEVGSENRGEPLANTRASRLVYTLDFAWGGGWRGGEQLAPSARLGAVLQEPLRPFEGSSPQRALIYPIKEGRTEGAEERPVLLSYEHPTEREWRSLPWSPTLQHSLDRYHHALAHTPWSPLSPLLLSGARLESASKLKEEATEAQESALGDDELPKKLLIIDATGACYPASLPEGNDAQDHLNALCLGGRGPLYLLGEWSPLGLTLLSMISAKGALISFSKPI